jgi:hypothetical protein
MSLKFCAGVLLLVAAVSPLYAGQIVAEPGGKKVVVEDYFP